MKDRKVFGIGFHKTGTSTLKSAASMLGYAFAPRFLVEGEINEVNLVARALEMAATVDAVQDNPWPLLFRELDREFPGSRFILTIRDTDEWWVSLLKHFGGRTTEMRTWIYGIGDPKGHESLYKERYEAHNAAVIDYFADRPDDLLVFSITDGEGWDRLCPFLDEPTPDAPFPHRRPRRNVGIARRIARRMRGVPSTR
ncbi:MAG: sulfotransferase family protein [Actinomycetota bacterium]